MKMDKVAGSGNDEFYTPEYAITPLYKYLAPPPPQRFGAHSTLRTVCL